MSDALANGRNWFDKEKSKKWVGKYGLLKETLYFTEKGNFIVSKSSGCEKVSAEFATCWLIDHAYELPEELAKYKDHLEV